MHTQRFARLKTCTKAVHVVRDFRVVRTKVRLNGVKIARMSVAQERGVTDAVIYMAPRGYGPLTSTPAFSRPASLRAHSVYLH